MTVADGTIGVAVFNGGLTPDETAPFGGGVVCSGERHPAGTARGHRP